MTIIREPKTQRQINFRLLLTAPNRKLFSSKKRADHYCEIHREHEWFTKIKVPYFCIDCRSEQCCDVNHKRVQLNPIIRIPRKTASKLKWKQFFKEVDRFHKNIL